MNGQTTRLYFFDGYIIWTSSFVSYSEPPITAKQQDLEVTVYGSGYISVEGDSYPFKTPDIHMHDHSDSEVAVVIPGPCINLRQKLAS
ncbi:unnamed protein product [marine sediment metagenome]|uniref:Uncharacterized protein n=1 Tax=marine sediment metagenome TaxID=412755 RepID=X1J5J1_9ZZZZ